MCAFHWHMNFRGKTSSLWLLCSHERCRESNGPAPQLQSFRKMTVTPSWHGMPSTNPYNPEVAKTLTNMFSNQCCSSFNPQTDFKAALDNLLTMGYEVVTLVPLIWELLIEHEKLCLPRAWNIHVSLKRLIFSIEKRYDLSSNLKNIPCPGDKVRESKNILLWKEIIDSKNRS